MMKKSLKITSLFISLAICFLSVAGFSGCARKTSGALTLDGVEIGNDVFTYFIDKAFVELGENVTREDAVSKATDLCSDYFKKNTLAHSEGVSLSMAEKANVSEKVNAHWGIYGKYYSQIGVTKQTLTKVFTADAYRDALLLHYYGAGGENEISVARLYASFKTNYIVFRSINGYFTYVDPNGLTQRYDDIKTEELILKFQNMASLVNAGEKTMEEAADFLAESGYSSSVATVVLKKGDSSYPNGFFDKVKSLESRKASVIGTTDYIFLVMRGDADSKSEYYLNKREEIIKDIVGTEIDTRIKNSFSPESAIDSSDAQNLYLVVKYVREGM